MLSVLKKKPHTAHISVQKPVALFRQPRRDEKFLLSVLQKDSSHIWKDVGGLRPCGEKNPLRNCEAAPCKMRMSTCDSCTHTKSQEYNCSNSYEHKDTYKGESQRFLQRQCSRLSTVCTTRMSTVYCLYNTKVRYDFETMETQKST